MHASAYGCIHKRYSRNIVNQTCIETIGDMLEGLVSQPSSILTIGKIDSITYSIDKIRLVIDRSECLVI